MLPHRSLFFSSVKSVSLDPQGPPNYSGPPPIFTPFWIFTSWTRKWGNREKTISNSRCSWQENRKKLDHQHDHPINLHLKSEQKWAMLGTSGHACKSLSVDILLPPTTSTTLTTPTTEGPETSSQPQVTQPDYLLS